MDNNKTRVIVLDIDDDVPTHVSKEEILNFFKDLKTMPLIDKEAVYQDILNNQINLPDFEFEQYFLNFCHYRGLKKECIIIQDVGSDNYYYIQDENVYQCRIYEAQKIFYGEIAEKLNQKIEDVHDTLIDKLKCYQAILLMSSNEYLSSLDDFIEDNIYMFDAALKEKEIQNKSKNKLKG